MAARSLVIRHSDGWLPPPMHSTRQSKLQWYSCHLAANLGQRSVRGRSRAQTPDRDAWRMDQHGQLLRWTGLRLDRWNTHIVSAVEKSRAVAKNLGGKP